ncbi:MAG: TrmH family RNA methyltransferase [Phycisphaerae bacterium]
MSAETHNVEPIESLDDPRVSVYRNLKDRELARLGGRFIAEGELVVRRLLASDFPVESVLLADRHVEEMSRLVPAGVPVYVAPAAVVNSIVGFRFHSGVIACGRRRPSPSLEAVAAAWREPVTIVVLPEVNKTDNLGAILRISGAFGAGAVILGERCCDPFYRQSVRVSMGAVFSLPLVQSADLKADLRRLRGQFGVQLAAAVLDGDAEPLASAVRPAHLAILLGNEAQGLDRELVELCDRRITIPMKLGTDSLNVAVAAGVFLYHFTSQARNL